MQPSDDNEAPPAEETETQFAPESHVVGTEVGAVGGGIAGAALGALACGPTGLAAGAALGATLGAVAGYGIAEGIDPESEQDYWQKHYRDEPYFDEDYTFEDYGPAYQLGWQNYSPHTTFDSEEDRLSSLWHQTKSQSHLRWEQARQAAKASWDRYAVAGAGEGQTSPTGIPHQ